MQDPDHSKKKKILMDWLRRRTRWMCAFVLASVILSLGSIFVVFILPLYLNFFHAGPLSQHAIESIYSHILVAFEYGDQLGPLNQVDNGSYYESGGYDIGFSANESVVGGLRVFQTVDGHRVLGLILYGGPGVNASELGLPPFQLVQYPPGSWPPYYVNIEAPQLADEILVVTGSEHVVGDLRVSGTLNASGIEGSVSCGLPANGAGACDVFQCFSGGARLCAPQQCKNFSCNGGTCVYTTVAGGCANNSDCSANQLCNTTTCSCYDSCANVNCSSVTGNPCGIYECQYGSCVLLRNDTGCCVTSSDCADNTTCDQFECLSGKCFRVNPTGNHCSVNSDCVTGTCNTTNCTCYDACAGVTCDSGNNACAVYTCHQGTCIPLFTNVPGCCHNDSMCNDNMACTTDTCDLTTHTCIHTPPNGGCYNSSSCLAEQFCDSSCNCVTPIISITSADTCVVRGLNDQDFFTIPRDTTPDSSVSGLLAVHNLSYYQWNMGTHVSISDDYMVTTAPYLDSVLIYTRSTYGWRLMQTITRPSNSTSANYGVWANSVAVSGNMIAIGHCTNGTLQALPAGLGLISIWLLNGTTWKWSSDILESSLATNGSNEACISGVSVYYTNSTVATLGADDSFVGRIYVATYTGGISWTVQLNYNPISALSWTYILGGSVAVSQASGNLVGAGGCVSKTSCQVVVFYYSAGWSTLNKFVLSEPAFDYNATATVDGSQFGTSIAIYEPLMILGAPYLWFDDTHDAGAPLNRSGAVVVYYESSISSWTKNTTIYNPEAESLAYYGKSLSLSGKRFAVGAPGNGGTGSVWVYLTDTPYYSTVGRMKQQVPQTGADYGQSVSVWSEEVMVGAPFYDSTVGQDSGAIFVVGCTGTA